MRIVTSYKSTRFVDEQGLWVAARDPNKIELSHHQEVSTLGAVADLRFNDSRQLLYTHRGSAMFGYYHNLGYQSTTASSFVPTSAHRNYANVRIGESLELSFAVEIPFFATHDTRTLQGTPVCHWRYLSYGISADRVEGFTMACLFISHTAANALRCTHQTNLERGRRLSRWLPVARLCDYPDSSVSTIGCRFAISPNGKRIAVMQWDTLYVWPLNPKEVISFDRSNYYPQSWISGERMDDNDMIELRPVIIRMGAVCFKLMFTENDDIIVGLTDRGLMTWDLRPQARRRRSTVNMDLEHISVLEHEPFVPKEYPEDGSREVAETSVEDAGGIQRESQQMIHMRNRQLIQQRTQQRIHRIKELGCINSIVYIESLLEASEANLFRIMYHSIHVYSHIFPIGYLSFIDLLLRLPTASILQQSSTPTSTYTQPC